MRELLLVRYGEIFLKGLNRPYFIRELIKKIRHAVKDLGGNVWVNDSRIFVSDFTDLEECIRRVTKVFGVHSVCPAIEMPKDDFEAICQQAVNMASGLKGTFKVSARRSDKRYFMDSPQINAQVGGRILRANPDLKVDVKNPDYTVNVEIRDLAYLYVRVIPAVGGMPVGTNGRATLLLSGGIDSPVAGWMIAKRGVQISAVHFHSYPYTSDRALEKVLDLARILSESCCGIRVHVVPFTKIQMEIHEKCPDDYTTLIMRRFMMRIAERVAQMEHASALITGESIGQVASQTMTALGTTDSVVTMPVFRPVIGFDKVEIIDIAQKIGTFETSSLPYEDCCTVFTPKHPATNPKMDKILEGESKLDAEALIEEAIAGIEIHHC
ncbi:MAG: tRNA 4-thiouridine(8) synthase ThiI [Clostridia bacterium]|nr:tRNA 4-thiouridine(8) synthase ThiI [Clostridia bacterium]MBQ7846200.1 tRNA 4-thiouridine(8) synthase ThiI [Clostridia bacterium]MBQ7866120.1 tRNA 4-thiouridine(8) synthase ThiI [Clostridia bacterium]